MNRSDLLAALQENLEHARHQENQREHHTFMYWTAWGATIGFIYTQGGDFRAYPWLFFLLALITLPVLMGTLKWSSEFANHMMAAATICYALGINIEDKGKKSANPLTNPLPYKEFRGYMALPLKMPIFLNVAVILSSMECFGLVLSVSLFLFGIIEGSTSQSFSKFFIGKSPWPLVWGVVAFLVAFGMCIWIYFKMIKNIRARTIDLQMLPQRKNPRK